MCIFKDISADSEGVFGCSAFGVHTSHNELFHVHAQYIMTSFVFYLIFWIIFNMPYENLHSVIICLQLALIVLCRHFVILFQL